MSTTLTGAARQRSISAGVTLTAEQWGQLVCLLSIHSRDPVMPQASTQVLDAALDQIESQLAEVFWQEVPNA